ncbi:MAG: hypothetical protein R2830_22545 [Saprospiraceae bacterium]
MKSTTRPLLSTLGFLLMAAGAISAQGMLQTALVRTDAGIAKSKADSLANAMSTAWAGYVHDAGLLNPRTGEVDDESIDAFKRHFSFNAKVFNDLADSPAPMHYSDYVSQVYRRLKKEGVRGWFEEAALARLSYDAAGFYRAEVKVVKRVLSHLGTSSQLGVDKERCFQLVYKFEIPERKFSEAAILSIEGASCPAANEGQKTSVTLAGLGQVAFPFFGYDLAAGAPLADSSIDFSGRPSLAGGLYLRTTLSPGSRFSLGAGLMISNLEVKARANNLKPGADGNTYTLQSLEETMHISYWDLMLGLHVRLAGQERFQLTADVIGTAHLRWNSYYDRRFYSLGAAQQEPTEVNIRDAAYWTYSSVGLGLTARYFFSPRIGLEAGAFYSAGLSPLFGQDKKGAAFLDDRANLDDLQLIFVESYFEKIRANMFGLRLGLVVELN